MREHQLAHVLTRYTDDLCHIGQADKVWRGLDQSCARYCRTDIPESAFDRLVRASRFPY